MNKRSLFLAVAFMVVAMKMLAQVTGNLVDSRDGKQYKTIKIGTQTWMAENLAFKSTSGCNAYENNEDNVKVYGYLYNWETTKQVYPSGWHAPSDAEWTILTTFLGGEKPAGKKLKGNWTDSSTDADNSSGFNALPGGTGFYYGETTLQFKYSTAGKAGFWWSSTDSLSRYMDDYVGIYRSKSSPDCFFSVRCIKD